METAKGATKGEASQDDAFIVQEESSDEIYEQFARKVSTPVVQTQSEEVPKVLNTKVFISHEKNKGVVEQLKEIIKFGKYEPVVSVENETLSKPVPDKVLDDMRSCFAGNFILLVQKGVKLPSNLQGAL